MNTTPTPEEIRAAREAAGLTQEEAAALAHITNGNRWSEAERGVYRMHPAAWELFQIKVGAHPGFTPAKAAKRA